MSSTYYVNQFLNMTADTFALLYKSMLMYVDDADLKTLDRQINKLVEHVEELEYSYDSDCLAQWIHDTEFKMNDIVTRYRKYCDLMLLLHNNAYAGIMIENVTNVEQYNAKILDLCKQCSTLADVESNRQTLVYYTNAINNIVSKKLNFSEGFIVQLDLFNNIDYIKYCKQEVIDKANQEVESLLAKVSQHNHVTINSPDRELVNLYLDHTITNNDIDKGEYIAVISSEELSEMYHTWAEHFNKPVQTVSRVVYYAASILSQKTFADNHSSTFSYQLTDPISHRCIKDLILIKIRYDTESSTYSFIYE